MYFRVDERLFQIFPGLKVGVIVVRIDNKKGFHNILDSTVKEIRENFPYERPQDHPHIRVWREGFSKVGISPSKFYSSVEALLRRVIKGGPFPKVNPLVDLYNALSLKYLVPIGGHALEPIEGDIHLCFAQGNETFVPMHGGETEIVEKGEVIYRDDREVLTRRWVWRQCDKDKVTEETRQVFLPVDLMEGVPEEIYHKILGEFDGYFNENGNGSVVHSDLLSAGKGVSEFSLEGP